MAHHLASPWNMPRAVGAAVLGLAASTLAQAQMDAAALQARSLAATCANCHGTNGQAVGSMPALAGMPADRLVATMERYRSGQQPATVMHQISKGYTPEQVKLMAGYFAAQKATK